MLMLSIITNQMLISFIIINLFVSVIFVFGHEFVFGPCLLQYLEPCSSETIQFYIFSSDTPNKAPTLLDSEQPVVPDYINLTWQTKIIVHGYAGNLDFNATKAVRNAYLTVKNTNVIVVDWGKLANLPCYPSASFNTKQAGICTANFLIALLASYEEFNLNTVHGIGFSLGAHAISFASNKLEKALGQRLTRITGLDPALPFFSSNSQSWKLDNEDADFVDVIHTNAGFFGKIEPSGHVDFYVNGGKMQKACENHRNQPLCSHLLAPAYFAESIISDSGFWGVHCASYFQYHFGWCTDELRKLNSSKIAMMGEPCTRTSHGIYFVNTNDKPPYAMGLP